MRDYKKTSDTMLSQTETKMQSDSTSDLYPIKNAKRLHNARNKKISIHSFSRFGFGLGFFFVNHP